MILEKQASLLGGLIGVILLGDHHDDDDDDDDNIMIIMMTMMTIYHDDHGDHDGKLGEKERGWRKP